nr:hypothetical protein [Angustibacter aerolatus]
MAGRPGADPPGRRPVRRRRARRRRRCGRALRAARLRRLQRRHRRLRRHPRPPGRASDGDRRDQPARHRLGGAGRGRALRPARGRWGRRRRGVRGGARHGRRERVGLRVDEVRPGRAGRLARPRACARAGCASARSRRLR